jgi:carbon storage regulator
MLVLTRKRGETIKIGSNIMIQVIKTSQGSVKIGINAPTSVRVVRGELVTVEDETDFEVLFQSDDETMEPCMLEAMLVQS